MPTTLILMRHGKAQRPLEGKPDEERKLRKQGARSLRAKLPQGLRMIPAGASVRVYSSPAARALQTARIVRDECKRQGIDVRGPVELVPSLWDQDFDEFCDFIRSSNADVVFAVGHNPFIEQATEWLTGSRIDFTTGGFAAIELSDACLGGLEDFLDAWAGDPGDFYAARLLWFVQGPVSQRWKTLVSMEKVLAEASDTVIMRLGAFFDDPEDDETMHKLRVSIRTLRSLVAFVAPWQKAEQNKACQRALKLIVACTSRLRELDVLTIQEQEIEGSTDALVDYCAAQAAVERARVLEELSRPRTKKRLKKVVGELHRIRWRRKVEANGLAATQVRERFDGLAFKLQQDLAALDIADAEATHDVRKDAKRVRYDAEQFESLLGEDVVDIAKGMVEHQDDLGAICDARVEIRIIDDMVARGVPEQVEQGLALMRKKYEDCLESALESSGA